jgi:prolyl-tRNA editing enzyme YbaK/EbsC (Cys-tRNA(Pro) deacylase)
MDNRAHPNTPAIRLLDAHGVVYVLLPHTEPVYTVAAAAAQRGVVAEEMVKSILLRESRSRRYAMACVLGPARLDHRAARALLGESWGRLTFAGDDEIAAVTGYPRGAVNPLALPDDVPVLFDAAIAACRRVNISSGDLMFGLELDPADLIRLAGARLGSIAEPEGSGESPHTARITSAPQQ